MKIFLKTEDEIELMRRANRLVAATLAELAKHIKPGVTTLQLDNIAEAFIRDHGGTPSFKNCPNPFGGPFPASICTSINRVVVHGIPSDKVFLKEGDIISVDCGAVLDGFNGDSCYTFCVGEVDKDVRQLLKTTKESLLSRLLRAIIWEISAGQFRTMCNLLVMVWFANSPGMVSDVRCTRHRRFLIMAVVVMACC